ncbi:CAP domain-containing protein [Methylobacterium sp. Leaf118]|uniref:CAP domain-containing protein n=1 Tax=Methylobacterium sp. Leaf118 TaxID=2876562 RepID=UPI001E580B34|nr:CAP domain-containing protein [Methylobacterium sp. Leaf118]
MLGRPPLLAAALALVALLPGCAGRTAPTDALPSLYLPLTTGATNLDTVAARDMISAYRHNNGAAPLAVDPELQRLAETEAAAMAAADRPSNSRTVRSAITRLGYDGAEANLSAGYHTLAEAFSGWRESAPHRAVMLAPEATRMGIATAYAPGSKYKVYWALLVAK